MVETLILDVNIELLPLKYHFDTKPSKESQMMSDEKKESMLQIIISHENEFTLLVSSNVHSQ